MSKRYAVSRSISRSISGKRLLDLISWRFVSLKDEVEIKKPFFRSRVVFQRFSSALSFLPYI